MGVTIIINNQALRTSGRLTEKDEEFFQTMRANAIRHHDEGRPQSYKPSVPVPPKPSHLRIV